MTPNLFLRAWHRLGVYLGAGALLVAGLFSLGGCTHGVQPLQESTIVYIVRHAEKAASDGKDPSLSAAGHDRAKALARMLKHIEIDALLSSDYRRTRQTLAPVAQQTGLQIQIYDASDSAGLVGMILTAYRGRTVVIAGHSNTVPEIVRLFVGERASDKHLGHEEYDRLYAVVLGAGAQPQVLALAYPF